MVISGNFSSKNTVILDKKLPKMTIVGGLNLVNSNRTPEFYTANIFTAKTTGFHCGTNPTAVSLHFLQTTHCKYFFAVFTFNICIGCL